MYSKQQLLKAIQNEIRIIKHLGSKVTDTNKGHAVAEKSRTAFELLKYVAYEMPAQVNLIVNAGWDQEIYSTWQAKGADFTIDQFQDAMDEAYSYAEAQINALSDEELATTFSMWGMTGTRTEFLVSYLLVFLGAYKTQLFLILKSSGLTELSTWNLWAGIDQPAQQ